MTVRFFVEPRTAGLTYVGQEVPTIHCLYPSKPPVEFTKCGCKMVHSKSCAFFVSDETTFKYKPPCHLR